jgi:hypothetical protein
MFKWVTPILENVPRDVFCHSLSSFRNRFETTPIPAIHAEALRQPQNMRVVRRFCRGGCPNLLQGHPTRLSACRPRRLGSTRVSPQLDNDQIARGIVYKLRRESWHYDRRTPSGRRDQEGRLTVLLDLTNNCSEINGRPHGTHQAAKNGTISTEQY